MLVLLVVLLLFLSRAIKCADQKPFRFSFCSESSDIMWKVTIGDEGFAGIHFGAAICNKKHPQRTSTKKT